MKNVFQGLFSIGLLVASSTLAFSNGSSVPQGYWSCTFWGQENVTVPGPGGIPQYQTRPRAFGSDWYPSKQDAYEDAKDYCQRFSSGVCQFSGCKQKSR